MEEAKRQRGRPKKDPADQLVSWTLRVPPPAKAKGQLHGAAWVAEVILKAKPPTPKKP